MQEFFKRIADAKWFQNTITIVIVLAGILVGMETYPAFAARHALAIHVLDQIIIWIFVVEMAIKMAAHGHHFYRYFKDPWNVFDFIIVAACFLPVDAQYVMVLRLARLLRVLKLVRALPSLQVLVSALLKSIPSMGYVSLLLILLFYVYAVAATFLFGRSDPVHFATLTTSMLSLFGVVTMEGWVDLMNINRFGCDQYGYDGMAHLCTAPEAFPWAAPFLFISLILIGTMVILNLFIGVIMNGMDAAREENQLESRARSSLAGGGRSIADDIDDIDGRLDELKQQLSLLKHRIRVDHTDSTSGGPRS